MAVEACGTLRSRECDRNQGVGTIFVVCGRELILLARPQLEKVSQPPQITPKAEGKVQSLSP